MRRNIYYNMNFCFILWMRLFYGRLYFLNTFNFLLRNCRELLRKIYFFILIIDICKTTIISTSNIDFNPCDS